MSEQEFDDFKIEALLRAYYFKLFAEFEKLIRDIFNKEVIQVDPKLRNKLYFYYGSNHGTFSYIDFEKSATVKVEKNFDENELFKDFTTIKIIKIDEVDNIIKKFNFVINSLNRRTVEFTFHGITKKLIEMRNILAHEPRDFQFKDKHIVELLATSILQEYNGFNFGDYDMSTTDTKNQELLSNLIYMNLTIEILAKYNLPHN